MEFIRQLYYRFAIFVSKLVILVAFKANEEQEWVSSEGIEERRNVPYVNRCGKEFHMDVFRPAGRAGEKLPVIVYVSGGGLMRNSRALAAGFCRLLAGRGYAVFSIEYRLAPEVLFYEQVDDVCAGFDAVCDCADIDLTQAYFAAESAGALLTLYAAALRNSEKLQAAFGLAPSKLNPRALALVCGMFYLRKKDMSGIFLSGMFCGHGERRNKAEEYLNPEHSEIINSIPPCYLLTSKSDMLERYTLDFAGALCRSRIEHKLRHMGAGKRLIHAFTVFRPDYPESRIAADEIVDFFSAH